MGAAQQRKANRVSRGAPGATHPQRLLLCTAGDPCCRHRWRRGRSPLCDPPRHVHRLPDEEEGRGIVCTRRTQESSQRQLLFQASKQRVLRLNFL